MHSAAAVRSPELINSVHLKAEETTTLESPESALRRPYQSEHNLFNDDQTFTYHSDSGITWHHVPAALHDVGLQVRLAVSLSSALSWNGDLIGWQHYCWWRSRCDQLVDQFYKIAKLRLQNCEFDSAGDTALQTLQ